MKLDLNVFDDFVANRNGRRLVRKEWGDGKATACLLAAIAPQAIDNPSACPACIMPQWLAHLTP